MLFTRREVASQLKLSLRTIDSLISKGDLPTVKIGRSVRVRRESIFFLIEARESRDSGRKKRPVHRA